MVTKIQRQTFGTVVFDEKHSYDVLSWEMDDSVEVCMRTGGDAVPIGEPDMKIKLTLLGMKNPLTIRLKRSLVRKS
jgi:hypothetical protein